MIPFFLRHYEPIVDRIVIFDDGSTDRSKELLAASPKVELRRLKQGSSYVFQHMEEFNECWKESRRGTDWTIITDIDEHLYHRGLRDYLNRCTEEGVTILEPIGYDMISPDFPTPNSVLTESMRCGVRSSLMDKRCVFDPNAIKEMNYTAGRHLAKPTGRIVFPAEREVLLLHYKNLGLDYLCDRSKALKSRKTDFDRVREWGLQYYRSAEAMKADFESMRAKAEEVIP